MAGGTARPLPRPWQLRPSLAVSRPATYKDNKVTMPHCRYFSALFLSLAVLAGCAQPARQEIPDVREPGDPPRQAPPKAGTQERLGMSRGQQQGGMDGITFHVDVPEGWEKLAEAEFRQVNLRMVDHPEAECYFTLLPGGGGGLEANINRWRRQMGLDPLSGEDIAALPKKALFGQPATFVDIEGTFAGMGGAAPQDGYRMYGLILHHEDPNTGQGQAFFLKMTGPGDVLASQESNFDLVASSLHVVGPGDDHTHDHGAEADAESPHAVENPHANASATENAPAAAGFTWTLPEGWEELAPRMMREANLTISGQPDVECYLTVLSGRHGGLDMNINRWRQQMGQPELSAEEIAALPKKPLLGGEASFVTIDGTFGGMSGAVQQENARMYGLVLVEGDQAYFVKMTGPRDILAEQEAKFLAFAASLQRSETAQPAAPATETAETPSNPHGGAPAAAEPPMAESAFQWVAPEGWEDGGTRMMREVTYEIGEVECYIAALPGGAGGVEANINRWVGQMGQPALDEAALAALPRIELLGQQAPMVEVGGDFTTMQGEEKQAYKLLGALAETSTHMVFVKMTGPGAEVDAQKEKFVAFCASITSRGAE